jgi:hypothetical protein
MQLQMGESAARVIGGSAAATVAAAPAAAGSNGEGQPKSNDKDSEQQQVVLGVVRDGWSYGMELKLCF